MSKGGEDLASAAVLPAPAEGRGGNMSSRKGAYLSASDLALLIYFCFVFNMEAVGSHGCTQHIRRC